jgi:hypothetical protein
MSSHCITVNGSNFVTAMLFSMTEALFYELCVARFANSTFHVRHVCKSCLTPYPPKCTGSYVCLPMPYEQAMYKENKGS